MKKRIANLAFLLLLSACMNPPKEVELKNASAQIDTTKAIKINSFWVSPKPFFEFNSLLENTRDTLSIVTCAEYVYSPFGKINAKSELKNSLLKTFAVIDRVDTMDNGVFEFQILKATDSRLILFFDNDPYASKESYILRGDINDSDINLINGIKIGMGKEIFIKTFFDSFPNELMEEYNCIVFVSCVDDIRHTYTFSENKLQSINFKSTGDWNVNY